MTTTTIPQPRLPGPSPLPLVGWRGSLILLALNPLDRLLPLYRDYGRIAVIADHPEAPVLAVGPEANRQILADPDLFHHHISNMFHIPQDSALNRLFTGLISMNGPQHREHRKLMMPAFHKKQVELYHDSMVALTQELLDEWTIGERRDIARDMKRVTLDIASANLLDLSAADGTREIGAMIDRLVAMLGSLRVVLFPFNLPATPLRHLLDYADRVEARIQQLIDEKRAAGEEQQDVLAMLIRARDEHGGGLRDAELVGHVNILFLAGHETSANALSWTLFLLDQHRQVLADLLDELDAILRGAPPTIEQLGQLTLLDHVIKESLRLLPPVVVARRISTAPTRIGSHEIPTGRQVLYSPYITHRLPELYEQPDHFLPERWRTITPSPYEYLPFSAGPRMCIGATFAMTEMKIVLAMLLQRFHPTLAPGARVDYGFRITLQPRNGLPMLIAPRGRGPARSIPRGSIGRIVDLE